MDFQEKLETDRVGLSFDYVRYGVTHYFGRVFIRGYGLFLKVGVRGHGLF